MVAEPEKCYAVTELETLAVVWALNYFHAYLYDNEVTVYTDNSAVKAVLETNTKCKTYKVVDKSV